MSAIERLIPWDQQPDETADVAPWALPGTLLAVGGGLREAVAGRPLHMPSGLAGALGPLGRELSVSSDTAHAISLPRGLPASGSWTALFLVKIASGAASYQTFFEPRAGGLSYKFGAKYGGLNWSLTVPGIANYASTIAPTTGAWYAVAFCATNGSTFDVVARRLDTGQVDQSLGNTLGTASTASGDSYVLSEAASGYGAPVGSAMVLATFLPGRWSPREAQDWTAAIWSVFADQRIPVPASVGGGAPQSSTASLQAIVQAARASTASIDVAVRAPRTATSALDAAVRRAAEAQASANVAVQHGRAVVAALDAAVRHSTGVSSSLSVAAQAARGASAALDQAVRAARAEAAALTAAVRAPVSASSALSAVIHAGGQATAVANAAVLAAAGAQVGIDVAVRRPGAGASSVGAAVVQMQQASAVLGAAVRMASGASAGVNAYVQAGTLLGAALTAAVLAQQGCAASVDGAVQSHRGALADLSAAVAVRRLLSAAADAVVRARQSTFAALTAYIQSGDGQPGAVPRSRSLLFAAPPRGLTHTAPARGLTFEE